MVKFMRLLKELRLFITLLFTMGGVSAFNKDVTLEYIYVYNIHLAVLIVIGIYVNHFLSSNRHKSSEIRLDEYQTQLNEVILENSVSQLKAEVRQAFKDYNKIEVIDFLTTIKYLRGLNERRIALGVNSYTEDMMNILLDKVQIGIE